VGGIRRGFLEEMASVCSKCRLHDSSQVVSEVVFQVEKPVSWTQRSESSWARVSSSVNETNGSLPPGLPGGVSMKSLGLCLVADVI
jgi:hypothetical protein